MPHESSTDRRLAASDALDRIDPELGAFITVDADEVLRAVSRARTGRLDGCLIAVKDLVDTAGLRTTYGSPRFTEHLPEHTAPVLSALLAEGAVVLGKTNLNEFAFGVNGYNPHFGAMLSPRDTSRTAGGSSGGSAAAVAAGVCDLAIGTDTSGSVRVPAACAGVWGFKCAHGLDLTGVYPLAPSYDSLGYLASGVDALRRVLDVERLPDVRGLRVGTVGVDAHPPPMPAEHWIVFSAEAWAVHGEAFTAEPDSYSPYLAGRLRDAAAVDETAQREARRVERDWSARYAAAVSDYDVLVDCVIDGEPPLLATAVSPDAATQAALRDRLLRHTPTANALGWPALAFPTSLGPRQVTGRPGTEPALLAMAEDLSERL